MYKEPFLKDPVRAADLEDAKPNHESLKELMLHTFGKRRSSIITDVKPVEQICLEYPLLQKANYVNVVFFVSKP